MPQRPIVGVTCDVDDRSFTSRRAYAEAILRAGGAPILLCPPEDPEQAEPIARQHADIVHAVVFTGGADPRTEPFGEPTHAMAKPMAAARQAYETALLRILDEPARRDTPVLGICLGMQLMGLHAGAKLDQHLPDSLSSASGHTADNLHPIVPTIDHPLIVPGSPAPSWHHQALRDPGRLRTVARSEDGVIEAVDDPSRPYYLGVQWHPERAPRHDDPLADGLFIALVERAREAAAHRASRSTIVPA